MHDKPLNQTNPHLRDPAKFRKALKISVASSTSIETGESIAHIVRRLESKLTASAPSSKPGSAQ